MTEPRGGRMGRLAWVIAIGAICPRVSQQEESLRPPPELQAAFRKAWELEVRNQDAKAAIEQYRDVETRFPEATWFVAASRLRRSVCLLRCGKKREAIALAQVVEDCPPEFEETRRRLVDLARPKEDLETLWRKEVGPWVEDLASGDEQIRSQAVLALRGMGSKILPLLYRALADANDEQVVKVLEDLVETFDKVSWIGFYESQNLAYPFTMLIRLREDGTFAGEILEPSMDWAWKGKAVMTSKVEGRGGVDGEFVFTKQYDDNKKQKWRYTGSRQGDLVTGTYNRPGNSPFMIRLQPEELQPPKRPKRAKGLPKKP